MFYAFFISLMHALYPAYHILLILMTLIITGENYKLRSSSLFNFLHPLLPLSYLRSKYSPQYSVIKHSQSMFFPYDERDQVSDPYKTTDKIIILYILIFKICRYETGR
jgi:hypothetical protein